MDRDPDALRKEESRYASAIDRRKGQRRMLADVHKLFRQRTCDALNIVFFSLRIIVKVAQRLASQERDTERAKQILDRSRQEMLDRFESERLASVRTLDELSDCLQYTGIAQLTSEPCWQFIIDVGHEPLLQMMTNETAM